MNALEMIDQRKINYSAIRYWLLCALLIAGFLYGVHRYFEYRDMQLDRRLELVQ